MLVRLLFLGIPYVSIGLDLFSHLGVFVGVSYVGRVAIECGCSVHSCGSRYLDAGVISPQ